MSIDIDKVLKSVQKKAGKIRCPDYLIKRIFKMIDEIPEDLKIKNVRKAK